MKSQNIQYLPAIDHIRAYAALLIVFFHGVLFITYQLRYQTKFAYDHWPVAKSWLSSLVFEGHTAVALFMVLSGFIFTIGTYGREVWYWGFIKNRLLRTYPLFLVLLFVGIAAFPQTFDFPTFQQVVLGCASQPNKLQLGAFSSMFWAISIEWQFYVLFPFFLRFLNQDGNRVLLGMIAVCIVMRTLACLHGCDLQHLSYWTVAGRMDQFLIGMIAGAVYCKSFRPGWDFDLLAIFALVLATVALYCSSQYGGYTSGHYHKVLWPTVEATLWAAFVLGYLSLARWIPSRISMLIAGIGTISYSIYLIHFVIIYLCIVHNWLVTFADVELEWVAAFNTAVIELPIVLAISTLTYFSVERPFLRLRVAYKR